MIKFTTTGTCAREISFEIIDGKLHNVSFEGGCPGNLKSISILTEGMEAADVAEKLRGITCGHKSTSCGDQFAKAILENL